LTAEDLRLHIETDGPLFPPEMSLGLAQKLSEVVWGQGFPPPRFRGDFRVEDQRVVGERHLKLQLLSRQPGARSMSGMLFGSADPLPDEIRAVFRLEANEFNGTRSLQLVVEHWEPLRGAVS
jgi:single-stranded-DNA-specific exonuclease